MTQDACDQRASLLSRKIHKADREKLRRDKLNEQFAELAAVLDSEKPKQDKASILGESLQLVNSLRVEIKRLRIERRTLFDESRDLKRERDDLEEEKTTLEKQTDELEAQVQQLLKSAPSLPCFKLPATPGPGPTPPFPVDHPRYAPPAFQFPPPHAPIPAIDTNCSNPFVYLTSPVPSGRVERPCAQYPVADFLSKVQSSRGFQAPRPSIRSSRSGGAHENREDQGDDQGECCSGCRDGGDSAVHLHLGQPSSRRHDVDTDLNLQLNPASAAASSSSAKGTSLCPS